MADSFASLTQTGRAFPLPTISEDTLNYVLHLLPLCDTAATAILITDYVNSLLPQPWLWNKDAWELKVGSVPASSAGKWSVGDLGSKLEGRMRVGDAVDDEWLVVWLLREISKKWPDFIIGVRDTDGEFLLIEAADALPSWVSPENADNRLWLQDGHLHLIPLSVRTASSSRPRQILDDDELERQYDPEAYLSEEDAVRAVRTGKYRSEDKMERAVWQRISCYPDALNTHRHKTKAYLPIPIAKVLKKNPELIQKATEGFYVRDPAQLRAAARMTHFPPSPSILTPVTLTRAAYAQLQGQVFHPPRVFGPEWHVREGSELDNERRWRDLGVKIATGFEIMYKEGGKKGRSGVDGESGGVRSDEGYQQFLVNLEKAGWFGDELEGSEKWKERELEALKGYQSVKSVDTASQRPSFAYLVDAALSSTSHISPDSLSASPDDPEDSDNWLEVAPEDLDDMLIRSMGRANQSQGDSQEALKMGEEDGKALHDLAQKVQEFVGGQGDMTAARFADELSDEEMDDSDDDEDEAEERKALEAEKQTRLQNLVPSLPAEQWGANTLSKPSAKDLKADNKPEVQSSESSSSKGKGKNKSGLDPIDDLKAKMRPPVFAKEEYDGVIYESESESESESELPPPGTLGRKISLMKWGEGEKGPQSARIHEIDEEQEDDEKEEKERKESLKLGDNLDEEMQRRVWGGGDAADANAEDEDEDGHEDEEDAAMEVDIDDDEEEDFLKFTREALGISDEMWAGIVGDRQARGAFVPQSAAKSASTTTSHKPAASASPSSTTTTNQTSVNDQEVSSSSSTSSRPKGKPTGRKVSFAETTTVRMYGDPIDSNKPQSQRADANVQANTNTNTSLDSFENVMRAMDEQLSKTRPVQQKASAASSGKTRPLPSTKAEKTNLPSETELDEMDEDELEAMDRELREALKSTGAGDGEGEDDEDEGEMMGIDEVNELDENGRKEYEMMRSFLESYAAQGGGSGVVGNLFGRLGKSNGGAAK
ncbi:hypothetical protein I317_01022 [Kwoniella heveanensis CBS 569]|uniref:SGT1-domain-containing protein n=1 Tax=Kwoniella heveanensis BCC8398 TaxID=1296120 RepID=A0A1B9GYN6_9TREE|nr:hypothetical protein I316_02013 [Kwoniella heveanensis BCC8398]OCF45219.1 hypothetical protein I317_01022 [Kwoniella heveanensis CBS 569]